MKTFEIEIFKRITACKTMTISAETEDEAINKAYESFSSWNQDQIAHTEDELSYCEEIESK